MFETRLQTGVDQGMRNQERINRTQRIDISHLVEDVAIQTGVEPESASAAEAEITTSGELRLTITGRKDLHSTNHRLPEELRGGSNER